MSARPRPVTATVTKPEWMKAEYAYRPYRYSLDSTGSTDSLISCLDHESYESSADDEQDASPSKPHGKQSNNESGLNVSCVSDDNKHDERISKSPSGNKKKVSRKIAFCDIENESMLSPWEKWLVQKAKEDRIAKQDTILKKKEEKLKVQIKEQEKLLALQKAEIKREEWLKKKEYEEKLKSKLQQQRLSAKKDIEESKKKEVEEKSNTKFQEWTKLKKEEDRKKKKLEKSKLEEEEKKRLERRELAEKKYEEWVKEAHQRPKSAPPQRESKGVGGNSQEYPAPSFYNPLPWQPIHIPKYKEDKKKVKPKKKKYVWNPNKYF